MPSKAAGSCRKECFGKPPKSPLAAELGIHEGKGQLRAAILRVLKKYAGVAHELLVIGHRDVRDHISAADQVNEAFGVVDVVVKEAVSMRLEGTLRNFDGFISRIGRT